MSIILPRQVPPPSYSCLFSSTRSLTNTFHQVEYVENNSLPPTYSSLSIPETLNTSITNGSSGSSDVEESLHPSAPLDGEYRYPPRNVTSRLPTSRQRDCFANPEHLQMPRRSVLRKMMKTLSTRNLPRTFIQRAEGGIRNFNTLSTGGSREEMLREMTKVGNVLLRHGVDAEHIVINVLSSYALYYQIQTVLEDNGRRSRVEQDYIDVNLGLPIVFLRSCTGEFVFVDECRDGLVHDDAVRKACKRKNEAKVAKASKKIIRSYRKQSRRRPVFRQKHFIRRIPIRRATCLTDCGKTETYWIVGEEKKVFSPLYGVLSS